MHEPQCLRHKHQQQQSGEELWTTEPITSEIWTHRVEPSVLPCRRLLRSISSVVTHSAMSDTHTNQPGDSPEEKGIPAASGPDFGGAMSPSYARTVFLGPDGLRPGWGFAFYLVIFLALQRIAVDLASARDLGASGLWSMLLEEFGSFVAAIAPSVVLARVEHRPWGAYGLPGRKIFGALFWTGVAWGFAAISLLMAVLYGAHALTFGHFVLHGVAGNEVRRFLGRDVFVCRLF